MERPLRKPKQGAASKAKPKANIKKENLEELVRRKKECERKAHEIVLKLIESPPVDKDYLLSIPLSISKQHMEDVIEERKLSQLCGWVLCDNKIDLEKVPKQTYSIRGHKVLDITERKSFCSPKCYAKASHFKAQLLTSPLWLRDMEEDVHFEILEDEDTKELHGLAVALTSVKLPDDSSDSEEEADRETANTCEDEKIAGKLEERY